VEAFPPDILLECLQNAEATFHSKGLESNCITKADLYAWGLLGRENSARYRRALLSHFDLPEHLSTNALVQVLSSLHTKEEIQKFLTSV
jgi:ribonuclease M5